MQQTEDTIDSYYSYVNCLLKKSSVIHIHPPNTYVISGGRGYGIRTPSYDVVCSCTPSPMASPPPPAAASQLSTHPRTSRCASAFPFAHDLH